MITTEQFQTLFPKCQSPAEWVATFNLILPKYEINTPKRLSAFLAQCGHESAGWTVFEENLNYSAQGLMGVFKKYFPSTQSANAVARQPDKIANIVYANRMGNGDTASGDGWNYRGRGPIQLTGKANYSAFADAMGLDKENILENPKLVSNDKDISLMSAVYFWNAHKLNDYADSEDLTKMTKLINGGTNGLDERIALYNKCISVLA
jgi:putative chitinase